MRKTAIIAGLAVFILAVLGAGGWHTFTGTPQYALGQAKQAMDSGDVVRFERYVDLEGVLDGVVDDLLGFAMGEALRGDMDGFEALGAALGGAMLEAMRPALKAEAKEAVLDAIKRQNLEEALEAGGEDLAELLGDFETMTFVGLGRVDRQGDVARIGLHMHDTILDETLTLTLGLERQGRGWQVRHLHDLTEFLETQSHLQTYHLQKVNEARASEFDRYIEVGPVSRRTQPSGWFSQMLVLEAPVTNIWSDTLRIVRIDLAGPQGPYDRDAISLVARDLAPGETGVARRGLILNPYIGWHGDLARRPILLNPSLVEMGRAGGQRQAIRLYATWSEYLADRLD
jgi:hypothetical protein